MFSTGGEWRWTSQKATCFSDSTYGRDRVPTRRLSMRKLNEVLRLRFELGLGQRAIARACSISQGAVHNYLPPTSEETEAAEVAEIFRQVRMGANGSESELRTESTRRGKPIGTLRFRRRVF